MKKLIGLLLAAFAFSAQATNCDLIIGQLDSFGNLVPRLLTTPAGCSATNGVIVYDATGSQQPRIFTMDSTLKFTSGVMGVDPTALPSTPFNFAFPSTRSAALSTDLQSGTPAKATIITITPTCPATLSLSGGTTCSMELRMGASALTCSTGTVVMGWTNGNTGTLTIGLNTVQTIGSGGVLHLPIGGHFILCPTSGTFTVVTVVEQAIN